MDSHPPANLKLPSRRAVILGGIGVGLVTLVYLGWQFANGWIAHDEGLILSLIHISEPTRPY